MKKILFIEDEPAVQKTVGEVLKQEGYEVISALDGEIGLRLAQTSKPDLILLDLVLPKLHGLEVLKGLKENEQTKQIPVIVLTNLEDMSDIEKALEIGTTTYLVKENYNLEEIVEKVKETLKNLNK
jgi:DNA-binding response OmpR family regulator